ncbi:EamA family transporter [Streptomyces sp. 8ZJF_21]|uniref:EamA family transporter n=1 Tax=Streptomyces sp. 8ZJF_21 TaxID=2903141 RepID=UPI001E3FD0BC|nr:EamA family transporter [Streptomyces sp. 8ZJF_21]MCD9593720.1 EamA family transporter [Streptomyces sp. 8ZJF_21]
MRPVHIALAVLVTALWGINFVVIEVGLDHFPPLLFCALRFLVAALPAVFLVGPPRVAWRWILGVGLALGVAKFGLLFIGMHKGMPAGLSSLVLQIQAVFTVLFASVVLAERPGRRRLLGMAVALAGIAVAAVDEGTSGPLIGFVLVVAAAAFWGVSNVLTRKAAPPDALNFMVWVSLVPVLPLLGLSLMFEGAEPDLEALTRLDWAGAGAIVYVAWVTTVFGFGVWGFLLRTYDASAVAPFSLLVPVFGMSSAALVLGEGISAPRWLAAALLVGGMALTSLPRLRLRRDARRGPDASEVGARPDAPGVDPRSDAPGAGARPDTPRAGARPDASEPDCRPGAPGSDRRPEPLPTEPPGPEPGCPEPGCPEPSGSEPGSAGAPAWSGRVGQQT